MPAGAVPPALAAGRVAVLPLAGRTVVVTRPLAQAASLAELIAAQGGRPLIFPLIDIAAAADLRPLQQAVAQLAQCALAVFISANAVAYSLPTLLAAAGWPAGVVAAAVGAGTAAALRRAGVAEVVLPSERFDSEALLELPALQADRLAGRQVLIFRGDGGRELIADTLRERGATVSYVTCYRRLLPASGITPLLDAWAAAGVDALTVSSSEGLRNLHQLLATHAGLDAAARQAAHARLCATPTFVPHHRIADAAAGLGHRHVILTDAADAGLIAGLCAYNWPPRVTSRPA